MERIESPEARDLQTAAAEFLQQQGNNGDWYNTSLGETEGARVQVLQKLPGEAGKVVIGHLSLSGEEVTFTPCSADEVMKQSEALRSKMTPYFLRMGKTDITAEAA